MGENGRRSPDRVGGGGRRECGEGASRRQMTVTVLAMRPWDVICPPTARGRAEALLRFPRARVDEEEGGKEEEVGGRHGPGWPAGTRVGGGKGGNGPCVQ